MILDVRVSRGVSFTNSVVIRNVMEKGLVEAVYNQGNQLSVYIPSGIRKLE